MNELKQSAMPRCVLFLVCIWCCICFIEMTSLKVERLPVPRAILGEGPHWDNDTQSLYYIDIENTELPLYRYDYAANKTYSAKLNGAEGKVSVIIPVEGHPNQFLISIDRKIGIIEWDGKSSEATWIRMITAVEQDQELEKNRINDGKSDPFGRFFFGTMAVDIDFRAEPKGSFYNYAKGQEVIKLFDKIYVSNGLAWNLKEKKFYYVDSGKYNIMVYEYDQDTGNIDNGRVLIDFRVNGKEPKFVADGMTIDRDGFLYVATFGGHKVLKVDPRNATVVLEILIPAEQITSVAFGGPNLDTLFVTSASMEFEKKQPDPAGSVFKVTGPGIGIGLPMKKVQI